MCLIGYVFIKKIVYYDSKAIKPQIMSGKTYQKVNFIDLCQHVILKVILIQMLGITRAEYIETCL